LVLLDSNIGRLGGGIKTSRLLPPSFLKPTMALAMALAMAMAN